MKRKFRIYQVDAFTKAKLAGNPAGVVPDAWGLSEEQMLRLARELNNSETAFLFPGVPGEYDVQVRFFTPTREVPICGHGTIAAHDVRALELGLDSARVIQKSQAGLFAVNVLREHGDIRVVMSQGKADIGEPLSQVQQAYLLTALGLTREDLRLDCPIVPATTGASKVMVGIRELDTLHALCPNMEALIRLSHEIGSNGYHVFTVHPGASPLIHGRMFGPANGVREDPVTGISNGPLGAYLVKFGLLPAQGDEIRFVAAQGEAMGRPGSMEVRVALEHGVPGEIRIVGDAVIAFQTEMELNCEA
ncbi:MAG: PhzF family phenazine biosynthesis isomerase [Lawsonibacter sp.]|nr:PhzF family phenazine biosynthesis isomerase [Lawsonibacter sp.]